MDFTLFMPETATPATVTTKPAVTAPAVSTKTVTVQTLIVAMMLSFVLAWHFHVPIQVTHTAHSITIDWSGNQPVPPAPIPPGPGPAPIPPGPGPAPAPTDKLRVLFVHDMNKPKTRDQNVTLYSTEIRAYLNKRCMTDADGRPAWRFWDQETNVTNESADWQAAMTAATSDPTPLPKMVIFAGTTLKKAYPVTTQADALKTLQEWGGN